MAFHLLPVLIQTVDLEHDPDFRNLSFFKGIRIKEDTDPIAGSQIFRDGYIVIAGQVKDQGLCLQHALGGMGVPGLYGPDRDGRFICGNHLGIHIRVSDLAGSEKNGQEKRQQVY